MNKEQIERLPAPEKPRADLTFEIVSDTIDEAALQFDEPAKFRTAVYEVLAAMPQTPDKEVERLAWERLRPLVAALRHFSRPEVTADAIYCLGHLNDEDGTFMSDLAAKHGMTRVGMFQRVRRLADFLGIEYQRRKIKRPKQTRSNEPTD